MKKSIGVLAVLALASPWMAAAQQPTAEAQIAEAVSILPEDLRAGATVVTYDASDRRTQGAPAGHQLPRVPAEDGRRLRALLQQGARRRAAISRRSYAPQKKTDEAGQRGRRRRAVKAGTLPPRRRRA